MAAVDQKAEPPLTATALARVLNGTADATGKIAFQTRSAKLQLAVPLYKMRPGHDGEWSIRTWKLEDDAFAGATMIAALRSLCILEHTTNRVVRLEFVREKTSSGVTRLVRMYIWRTCDEETGIDSDVFARLGITRNFAAVESALPQTAAAIYHTTRDEILLQDFVDAQVKEVKENKNTRLAYDLTVVNMRKERRAPPGRKPLTADETILSQLLADSKSELSLQAGKLDFNKSYKWITRLRKDTLPFTATDEKNWQAWEEPVTTIRAAAVARAVVTAVAYTARIAELYDPGDETDVARWYPIVLQAPEWVRKFLAADQKDFTSAAITAFFRVDATDAEVVRTHGVVVFKHPDDRRITYSLPLFGTLATPHTRGSWVLSKYTADIKWLAAFFLAHELEAAGRQLEADEVFAFKIVSPRMLQIQAAKLALVTGLATR